MAHEGFLTVFSTLTTCSIRYLVVGGTAVSYYGHYRPSVNAHGQIVEKPDLDIWYHPTHANYYALLKVLAELGQDTTRYWEEIAPDPKNSFFRYEFDDYTLDLLPRLRAPLDFSTCFKRRTTIRISEIEISFINLQDLLLDKQALGRPKDLTDIQNLRSTPPPLTTQ